MNRSALEFIPAISQPTRALVVVSHGLGDTADGWSWLPSTLRRFNKRFNSVAFVFPTAGELPITWQGGMTMNAWYDIVSLNSRSITAGDGAMPTGLDESRSAIHGLLDEYTEKLKLPSSRALLGGFSQGGALALSAGLSYPKKLGGIFAMSSYLPIRKDKAFSLFASDGKDANKETPILMLHGDADPVVSLEYGQASAAALQEEGYDVTMKVFSGVQHSVDDRGLKSLAQYIEDQLDRIEREDQ